MKLTPLLLALFLGVALSGCASKGPTSATSAGKPRPYNQSEKQHMTLCIGIADTARHAAIQKLKGVPSQEVMAEYANSADQKLQEATVHKVYHDRFNSAWDYSIAFFRECAKNLAEVAPERSDLAAYCFQNQLIADVAYGYKEKGDPKQNAYEHFAEIRSATANTIIDQVYASERSRTQIKLDVWDACMQRLVKD